MGFYEDARVQGLDEKNVPTSGLAFVFGLMHTIITTNPTPIRVKALVDLAAEYGKIQYLLDLVAYKESTGCSSGLIFWGKPEFFTEGEVITLREWLTQKGMRV